MKKAILLILICFLVLPSICIARDYDERGGSPPEGRGRQISGMGKMDMPPGRWWKKPEIAERLKLTGEEQEKLDSLFIQNKRRLIDLKSEMEKENFELEIKLDEDNIDEAACTKLFKKVQDARTNLVVEQFKLLIEVRKLLGNDRFQQLKKFSRRRSMNREDGRKGRKNMDREDVNE